jgi:putative N6-adenine-specific DNA methylase
MRNFKQVAKTFHGLEEVLAKELKELGAKDVKTRKRAVEYYGNKELLYKANLQCRTALRILQPIFYFQAPDEDELYGNINDFEWEEFMDNDMTFAIDSVVFSSTFTHSKYVALKTKDAIVDRFKDRTGVRPNVSVSNPDLLINVHVYEQEITISFDASGKDALYKRGYRKDTVEAPINEVLAAGMIAISGWDKNSDFIDPMCGSGTLPIEAGMAAKNIAPGLNRSFGFQNWKDYEPELFAKVKQEAIEGVRSFDHTIFAYDSHMRAIRITEKNIATANLEDIIKVKRKAFEKQTPIENKATLIFNPPYGERLETTGDIEEFYEEIGDVLKNNFKGCDAWIISSNQDALRNIGLKSSKRTTLFNGKLECWFTKYEMY